MKCVPVTVALNKLNTRGSRPSCDLNWEQESALISIMTMPAAKASYPKAPTLSAGYLHRLSLMIQILVLLIKRKVKLHRSLLGGVAAVCSRRATPSH